MKRNILVLYLVAIFLWCFSIPLPSLCLAYPQPLWVQQYMSGTFQIPEAYFGVGSATFDGASPLHDERELARKLAINDLSYNLSVVIKSEFANRIAQEGDFADERVESSLFVTTRLVLSGIEPKESWTDTKKHCHWVLVTIEKQEADKQVAQQNFINEVIDRLEGKQDEVIQGIKAIEEVLSQRLTAYEGKITHLTGLVETIDSKIEHAGTQTKQEYALLQGEIKRLEQVFHTSQSARMEELIRQNKVLYELLGKVSQKIDKDYFLSLSSDDMQYQQANPQFRVRIEPDRGQGADYFHGEKIRFRVRASRDCYLKVIYLSTTTEGARSKKRMNTLLFPNTHEMDNKIRAGETMVIGRLGELEINPPYGKDVITVVGSERQFSDLEETLQQAKGSYYTTITATTRGAIKARTRGIEVSKPFSGSVATDTCFIVSHPR